MRVAAVLVTHNRPQLLLQALAALRAQTRPLDAIYIVDNASDPGSDAAGVIGPAGGVTLLRSDINLGGAGGFALGMTRAFAAGHDWIWLLDDDAIARPDALARLLDAAASLGGGNTHDGLHAIDTPGALCGTVREFGDIALRHRRRYHLPSGIERPLPRAAYTGPPCRVDTASFVGFLVSADAVAAIGMPERTFFLGYDDTEYSLRLGRAGYPLWLVPDSVVEHLRARRARLRAGPFGARHYFTIRNRLAVAHAYASWPLLPTAVGLGFGLALWLVSGGRLRRGAVHILLRALADGIAGRLGPFPETLAKLQARAPPAPGPAGTTSTGTGTGTGTGMGMGTGTGSVTGTGTGTSTGINTSTGTGAGRA